MLDFAGHVLSTQSILKPNTPFSWNTACVQAHIYSYSLRSSSLLKSEMLLFSFLCLGDMSQQPYSSNSAFLHLWLPFTAVCSNVFHVSTVEMLQESEQYWNIYSARSQIHSINVSVSSGRKKYFSELWLPGSSHWNFFHGKDSHKCVCVYKYFDGTVSRNYLFTEMKALFL